MSSRIAKAKKSTVKHVAYEKKQEEQGSNVVKWIIGVLIALAIVYAGWSIYLVA